MQRGTFIHLSMGMPFGLLALATRKHIFAPFYHSVSEHELPHLKYLYPVKTPAQFEAELDFMLKHFTPIGAEDAIGRGWLSKQFPKPPLLLSFDDGLSQIASVVAPILVRKGVPATFFVNTGFVNNTNMLFRCKVSLILWAIENAKNFTPPQALADLCGNSVKNRKCLTGTLLSLRHNHTPLIERILEDTGVDWRDYLRKDKPYLTLHEIKNLATQGFTIGAHSVSHPNLSYIPSEDAIKEICNSLDWVQENIPNQPRLFSFPFTDHGLPARVYDYFFSQNPLLVDCMFGTAGLKPAWSEKLRHRIPMEVPGRNAREVLGGEMLLYAAKCIVGRGRARKPLPRN